MSQDKFHRWDVVKFNDKELPSDHEFNFSSIEAIDQAQEYAKSDGRFTMPSEGTYEFRMTVQYADGTREESSEPCHIEIPEGFQLNLNGVRIMGADVWNRPDQPYMNEKKECPKCHSWKTENRKLFTNDYIHCFNCDGGEPEKKDDAPKVDLSNLKY